MRITAGSLMIGLLCLVTLPLSGSSQTATNQNQIASNAQPPATNSEYGPEPEPAGSLKIGLMPKRETGALEFLQRHPEYDGRNTIVAIFDTGVDPGVAGLQKTPDGKKKIIDIVDGTGSGDVDTSTVRKLEDGKLVGLTGRELKLGKDWKNPTGKFHLGMKAAYDFFPNDPGRGELVQRLQSERKEEFNKRQANRKNDLRLKIANWKKKTPKPNDKQKQQLAELEAQLEAVESAVKNYRDAGPIFDCVVFHDGKAWQAVIDTDEDGNLAEEKVMTNYRTAQQFATFADPASLNFGVNIYEAGNLLSIVADSGAHATHVAGIVAAYYPESPELNGVAPGAQIVSVKIGDNRMYGMETGPGFERGITAVLQNKCDMINMSYGEPTITPNHGRLTEMFSELVDDHGVVFVSSAGNAGPALSTVGAPGGTTSALIGVGAYVSPEMMRAEYTMFESQGGLPFTWTSRGPTTDGDLGVDIFAPGGAISPIPTWTLQRSEQYNGTSMASPNACGNIALMISAAKDEKVHYTPYSILKALKNTAVEVERADKFAQGAGLIQVGAAYDHLKSHSKKTAAGMAFDVHLPSRGNARGVYLREPTEIRDTVQTRVSVNAVFPDKTPNKTKIDFELRVRLESTADWVKSGDYTLLTNGANAFDIRVDPTDLDAGVHYAEINAYDADDEARGVLFTLPVTVIKPHSDLDFDEDSIEMSAGEIVRRFYAVPEGATWAKMTLTTAETSERRLIRVHTMQLVDGRHFEAIEGGNYLPMNPEQPATLSFPVVDNRTLEVCLTQYWSNLGDCELNYEIEFLGVDPSEHHITIGAGEGPHAIDLASHLRTMRLKASGSLDTHRQIVLPEKHEIKPLDKRRYATPSGETIYEMTLNYHFEQSKAGKVTPRFLELEDLLYDAVVGPFLFTIFDENGHAVATNDFFPDAISLQKGDFKLVCSLRHKAPGALEKWKGLKLSLDRSLSKPVSLSTYASPAAFGAGKSGLPPKSLQPGESYRIYVGEPATDDLPDNANAGDQLIGKMKFSTAGGSHSDGETHPTGFPIRYVVGTTETSAPKSEASKDSISADRFKEELAAFKLSHLKKLTDDKDLAAFEKLARELLTEAKDKRKILVARLHRLDDDNRKKRLDQVIEAADAVVETVEQNQLAMTLGKRVPDGDKKAEAAKKKADAEKADLVDALYRKTRAIAYKELPDVVASSPIKDQKKQDKAFDDAFKALSEWVDTTDEDYGLVHVRKHRRDKRYGLALKLLNKHFNADDPEFLHLKKQRDIYKLLGWKDLQANAQSQLLLLFPNKREEVLK